jgi:malate synthase
LIEQMDLRLTGIPGPFDARILTQGALAFVGSLARRFEPKRQALLALRADRSRLIAQGEMPRFLKDTLEVREGQWQVAQAPADLQDRRVEITGPVDKKMMINALNSGAQVFMADFEDSLAPTWPNLIAGQAHLNDAIRRQLTLSTPYKTYKLNERTATLMVRPRGWHLVEKHVLLDGVPISASLFDFGLYFFHNALESLQRGSGPYFYLPKLESHQEARLWNQVFVAAQEALGLPQGTIRATVLIETILAAFEMEEILYELKDHSAGLNAGRWDYLFSIIKKFGANPAFLLPDRAQLGMGVPFMRAYAELLVQTCHKRGAHAIGGMAAFIPNRKDAQVTETALAKVREDKQREAAMGFDGTWVAHPDLVLVARVEFEQVLDGRPNQKDRALAHKAVQASMLLDVQVPDGKITPNGLNNNVDVALRYLASWLAGTGAVAIHNLMEDAATAEIARSQIWQWLRLKATLEDGRTITADVYKAALEAQLKPLDGLPHIQEATALLNRLVLSESFIEFLTWPAYEILAP